MKKRTRPAAAGGVFVPGTRPVAVAVAVAGFAVFVAFVVFVFIAYFVFVGGKAS